MNTELIIWNLAATSGVLCLFSFFIAVSGVMFNKKSNPFLDFFYTMCKVSGFMAVVFSSAYLIMRIWM